MQGGVLSRVMVLLALIGSAVFVAPARAQLIMDEPPAAWAGMELEDTLGNKLPMNLDFTDSYGNPVKVSDLFKSGRPVIMLMAYHRCPLLCPHTQEYLISQLDKLDFTVGQEFDVVVVSFDPRDSTVDAEKAKARAILMYTRQSSEIIRQGFRYLTGRANTSRALAESLGFPYRYLPESGEYSHGTAIYVITPEGTISRCFPKLNFEERDLRLALVEATDGKVGTLLDRITLWCYHPDSATGKYLIAPMRVMQLGAGLCGGLVVGLVGGLWMWERRRRRRPAMGVTVENQATPRGPSSAGLGTVGLGSR